MVPCGRENLDRSASGHQLREQDPVRKARGQTSTSPSTHRPCACSLPVPAPPPPHFSPLPSALVPRSSPLRYTSPSPCLPLSAKCDIHIHLCADFGEQVKLRCEPVLSLRHHTPPRFAGIIHFTVDCGEQIHFLQVSSPSRQSIKKVTQYSEIAEALRTRYANSCVLVQ